MCNAVQVCTCQSQTFSVITFLWHTVVLRTPGWWCCPSRTRTEGILTCLDTIMDRHIATSNMSCGAMFQSQGIFVSFWSCKNLSPLYAAKMYSKITNVSLCKWQNACWLSAWKYNWSVWRLDPLGELTALYRPPNWIYGIGTREWGEQRQEGREKGRGDGAKGAMRETERRGRKEREGKGNLAPRSFIKVGV